MDLATQAPLSQKTAGKLSTNAVKNLTGDDASWRQLTLANYGPRHTKFAAFSVLQFPL